MILQYLKILVFYVLNSRIFFFFLMRSLGYRGGEGNNILPHSSQTEWNSYFQGDSCWSSRRVWSSQCWDTSLTSEEKAEGQVLLEPQLACAAFVFQDILSAYTVEVTFAQKQMSFISWTVRVFYLKLSDSWFWSFCYSFCPISSSPSYWEPTTSQLRWFSLIIQSYHFAP